MSSMREAKAVLLSENHSFVKQYAYLFLTDIVRVYAGAETYADYEKREPGYGQRLLQAYQFAFTTKIEDGTLNHALLQGIHRIAMSHLKKPAGQYKNGCNNFSLRAGKGVLNSSATEKGFYEFLERWMLKPKRPIHVIHIEPPSGEVKTEQSTLKASMLSQWGIDQAEFYIATLDGEFGVRPCVKQKMGSVRKLKVGDAYCQLLWSLFYDLGYTMTINSGPEELVAHHKYSSVEAAVVEMIEEHFDYYNTHISQARQAGEKLEIIVETVQKISQLHAFLDGNIRTCKILMDRLMYQQGFSFSLMIDNNRFDCFDHEALIRVVQEGQKAFLNFLHAKMPDYPELLKKESFLLPCEIPPLKEEIIPFIQLITTPRPPLEYKTTSPKEDKEQKMVSIAPGETARLSAKNAAKTGFFLSLQRDRRAIILKDKQGNVSVTHVDNSTAIGFVAEEARFMQGEYTVDIVKHPGDSNNSKNDGMYSQVQKALGRKVKNSKNEDELRSSKTGNLLVEKGKILVVPITHFSESAEGAKPYQARAYERFFLQAFTRETQPPTLVYWDGWTGDFPTAPPGVRASCEEAYENRENEAGLSKMIRAKIIEVRGEDSLERPSAKAFLGNLPSIFKGYWECTSENLYMHISGFFSRTQHPAEPMPGKVIELITEYAESKKQSPSGTRS